jgi:thiamine-phosphate pyrophosphorylase
MPETGMPGMQGTTFPPLYAILDPALAAAPIGVLSETFAAAGVRLMQLRDKRATARQLCEEAGSFSRRLAGHNARLILNDRPDIAAICGAAGVHVGQQDIPVEEARRLCAAPLWVGVSTHNLAQLRDAARTSADYIAVGPIFATSSKENPDPVVGLDFLRAARRETRKPLVAIGGITVESASDVYRAGADSIAVIRDLLAAPDPGARAREYLTIAERALSARS